MVDDGVVVPLMWPVEACGMGVGFQVAPLWE